MAPATAGTPAPRVPRRLFLASADAGRVHVAVARRVQRRSRRRARCRRGSGGRPCPGRRSRPPGRGRSRRRGCVAASRGGPARWRPAGSRSSPAHRLAGLRLQPLVDVARGDVVQAAEGVAADHAAQEAQPDDQHLPEHLRLLEDGGARAARGRRWLRVTRGRHGPSTGSRLGCSRPSVPFCSAFFHAEEIQPELGPPCTGRPCSGGTMGRCGRAVEVGREASPERSAPAISTPGVGPSCPLVASTRVARCLPVGASVDALDEVLAHAPRAGWSPRRCYRSSRSGRSRTRSP